ncbi:MAG: hypothetical protein SCM96_07380 [Acidobacteriota bacterium]|nr:hypothetical protein [Acidobacteriota bacterium]
MKNKSGESKLLGVGLTALLIVFAVWLVSPFLTFDAADAARARTYGYRLALGLTLLLVFVGKWFYDVLAPQGLARKVSTVKAVAVMTLGLGILVFVIFIIGRAVSLYLGAAWSETTFNY